MTSKKIYNKKTTTIKKFRRDASFFLLSSYESIKLKELCSLGVYLDSLHAIPATSSNFSLQVDKNSFLISRSGMHKRDLNPSCFVRVDLEGKALSPVSPKPSDETLLHALIYKFFPKAQAVAHCHAQEFEKFKAPGHTFEGHELLKALGIQNHTESFFLPVFKNSQDMEKLAKEIELYLKNNDNLCLAFMLENHGIYCFGNSVKQVQNFLEVFFYFSR